MTTARATIGTTLAMVLLTGSTAAASTQQVFPTSVEVVAVDVTVVDKHGRPVEDLQPSDFEVGVGRRPRRILSAELVRLATTPSSTTAVEPSRTADPQPAFSSNRGVPPGRLIVLVPDVGSLSSGAAHTLAEAAGRFVQALTPQDRVALVSVPNGPSVDFTRDRARVTEALRRLPGGRPARMLNITNVSVAEAFSRFSPSGDRRLWCEAVRRASGSFQGDTSDCLRVNAPLLEAEAWQIYSTARSTSATSIDGLLRVLRGLARVAGPKTVVYFSQGLVTGRSVGDLGADHDLAEVGRAAAAARASVYTIHLDRSVLEAFDVSQARGPSTPVEDARLESDGLEAVAGYTGGALFKGVTATDFAFERVAAETSATWLLSFEPEKDDRDGKPHEIRVKVKRDGVEVRSRPQFVVGPKHAAVGPEERVRLALDAPSNETGVALAVRTYSLGHEALGEVGVLMVARASLEPAAAATTVLGYRVVDEGGRVVAGMLVPGGLEPRQGQEGALYYSSSCAVKPGRYLLKLAVAEAAGRTGSIEHPFDARLSEAGPLSLSDILVAHSGPEGKATLDVDGRVRAGALRAYVEVQGAVASPPVAVRFEITAGASPEGLPLVAKSAPVLPGAAPGRWTAETTLDAGVLAPGRYALRAVVSLDAAEVGRVVQPIEIGRP